jgi:hypothetical protein
MQNEPQPPAPKAMTLDEHFKQPTGSFAEFVKRKEDFLESLEHDRQDRIRSARRTACEMSWAA